MITAAKAAVKKRSENHLIFLHRSPLLIRVDDCCPIIVQSGAFLHPPLKVEQIINPQ